MTTVVKLITSPFCPTQIDKSLPPAVKNFSDGARFAYKRDPSYDKSGRLRVMHKGTEICNNSTVLRDASIFLHICKKCKTGHGENSCEVLSKHIPSAVTNSSEKTKKVG